MQNDDRTTCVDCGAMLGRPMTEAEEAQAEAVLDDKLDGMAERAQDFYVSIPQKVMGILCILGVIAAVVMLNLVGVEKTALKKQAPEHTTIISVSGAIVSATAFDPETGEMYEPEISKIWYRRSSVLEDAAAAALIGMMSCIFAAPALLFPKLVWWLGTLKFRLWYDWEPSPTYFHVVMNKIAGYVFFGIGIGGVIYSYFLYF